MANKKLDQSDVLTYSGKRNQETVRRHYLEYRRQQGLPLRCDNPECCFYSNKLEWNGKELKLILDHINGVCGDNYPNNLRLLCPNCNSQQATHGGGNKGRVVMTGSMYGINKGNGLRDYVVPVKPSQMNITVSDLEVVKVTAGEKK